MEELDSLEETLNESIQESVGARSGKVVCGKKKENVEDEDDMLRYILFPFIGFLFSNIFISNFEPICYFEMHLRF